MVISCLPGNCLRLHHLFFLVKTSSSSGGEVNSSKQVLVELLRIPKRRDLIKKKKIIECDFDRVK